MSKEATLNGIKKSDFEKVVDGKQTHLYILSNKSGMEVSITNYGGKIVSLLVPDKNKNLTDVVLGHGSIDEYLTSQQKYFGALVGRVANRIAKGKFSIGTNEYQLEINNAPNIVHGGPKGFSLVVWDAEQLNETTLKLTLLSPDGDQGFPGNLKTVVTYQLADDGSNTLQIHYEATTDKETIVNLTNHSFFNLSGAGTPTILDHLLTIYADGITSVDENKIPTGEITPVTGTPFDFNTPQPIGSRIEDDSNPQIKLGNGYDMNFVLNRGKTADGAIALVAKLVSPVSGIAMEVHTTEIGLQVYSGNFLNSTGTLTGKENKSYPKRSAITLQAQHFPDSVNHPEFPSVLLLPGKVFTASTNYSFSVV